MAKLTLVALASLLICSQVILAQMPDFSSMMGGGSNPMGGMGSMLGGFGGMGGNSNNNNNNNNYNNNGGQYPNENFDHHYNGCPSHQQCQCQQQKRIECNQNSCRGNQVCCRVSCCKKECVHPGNGK